MATPAARRRPIVGVSTKMYFSLARMRDYTDALVQRFAADGQPEQSGQPGQPEQPGRSGSSQHILDRVEVFVLPDFVSLSSVVDRLRLSGLRLQPGAQDCGWDDYGAFTGVISPAVLADLGVRIVEIGHAERRLLFAETDATTAAKAAAIARHGMVPLICIGEREGPGKLGEEKEGKKELKYSSDADQTRSIDSNPAVAAAIATVVAQVAPVLAAVPATAEVLLAYEPIWAIGAAQPASPAYIRAVVAGLRASVPVQRRAAAAPTRILYGGSAGPGLFAQLGGVVDGLFLGRFGHDADVFVQTVREVAEHA